MKNKKIIGGVVLLAFVILTGEGCDSITSTQSTQEQEQAVVQETHARQAIAVPLPHLDNSLERINIKKRLETFDDPNKVSYIYLVNYGRVMAFYTIKGKVTSGNKRLTPTQTIEQRGSCGNYTGDNCALSSQESPELDGSYGSSAPYIYFWTTEGAYVQWSGDYMLVDQPLKLATQPELVREIK